MSYKKLKIMAARKQYGFYFENKFITENKLIKETNYTGKFDAYTINNVPVQIKTTKSQCICFDSAKRMILNTENFILVINYRKNNSTKIYYIDAEKFKAFLSKYDILNRVDYVDWALTQVSNDKADDEKWKALYSKKFNARKLFKDTKIQVNGKRDHKSQKRVQLTINNIDSVYKEFQWQPEETLQMSNFIQTR